MLSALQLKEEKMGLFVTEGIKEPFTGSPKLTVLVFVVHFYPFRSAGNWHLASLGGAGPAPVRPGPGVLTGSGFQVFGAGGSFSVLSSDHSSAYPLPHGDPFLFSSLPSTQPVHRLF